MADNVDTPSPQNPGAGKPLPAGRPGVQSGTPPANAGRPQSAAVAPRPERAPEPGEIAGRLPLVGPLLDIPGAVPQERGRPRFLAAVTSPVARSLTVFSVGVASTLAWQSYSDAGREAAAQWCQSIAPRQAPLTEGAPPPAALEPRKAPAPAATGHEVQAPAAAPAPEERSSELLKSTSQVLAGVRESMDRLTSEIARLQTDRTPDRATSTMASGQPPASKPPPRPGH